MGGSRKDVRRLPQRLTAKVRTRLARTRLARTRHRRANLPFSFRVARSIRINRYRWMSTLDLSGATVSSPTLAVGKGKIDVDGCRLGYWPSPFLMDSCIHLEARARESVIRIGSGSVVNNGTVMIAAGPGIHIGHDVLLGPGVHIYDSDFHALDQSDRASGPRTGVVQIADRVFVGSGATICKGVSIGEGAVIGAGSVVVSDIPPAVVAAGNPCRVVGPTGERTSPS